jgi:uncharacterized protein (DUF58 family)
MADSGSREDAIAADLFARIKSIQIRTRHLVTDVLAGEYESAFKGRGMEFDEVREYQPGDDVRTIDWNVTARTSVPHVKVHREERELTVMLLVDVSASGDFGSTARLKNELAAETAAVLAYTAVKNNDRVGLIIFSDQVERYIPPKKGSSHVWRVIREILAFSPERHTTTDLAAALEFLGKVVRRRSVAFVISDFLDEGFDDELRVLAKRHDLNAVTVSDPREHELPDVGLIELQDAETGELVLVDTSSRAVLDGFKRSGRVERSARRDLFRASGVGRIDVRTDASPVDAIIRFFRGKS